MPSEVPVKSRTSSTYWKASPRCMPYSYAASASAGADPLSIATALQLLANSEAVLQ